MIKRLPKLPLTLASSLGPVSVTTMDNAQAVARELYGIFKPDIRCIEIAPGMDRSIEWMTLWHEATHVALTDSGAANALTEQQAEIVCDAMGSFLTHLMRAGQLTIRRPVQASPKDTE